VGGVLRRRQVEEGSFRRRYVDDDLCAPAPRGGAWLADDSIIFAPTPNSGLLRVPAAGGSPAAATVLGPDGRWLAYTFDETGRLEVYVRAYLDAGRREQISLDGGTEPMWSPSGRELFFRRGPDMMAVEIRAGSTFDHGPPRVLFSARFEPDGVNANYDVSPDGQRFVMIKSADVGDKASRTVVTLNWRPGPNQ
jgi:WD40 repeat protein